MKVLKEGTCSSMTGASVLTYHWGVNDKGEFFVSLQGNTGGGRFNSDWVPLDGLLEQLKQWPKEKPVTAAVLRPMFKSRSTNTPSFLLAVLAAEKIIVGEYGSYALGKADILLKELRKGLK